MATKPLAVGKYDQQPSSGISDSRRDKELLQSMRKDPTTMETLDKRYRHKLTCFALHKLRNFGDAQDVVQDLFTQMARNPEAFIADKKENHEPQKIMTATYRLILMHVRGRQYEWDRSLLNSDRPSDNVDRTSSKNPSPFQGVVNREIMDAINKGLQELTERQKQIFVMRHIEGMRQKEIYTTLRLSRAAVCKVESKSIGKLREFLIPIKTLIH